MTCSEEKIDVINPATKEVTKLKCNKQKLLLDIIKEIPNDKKIIIWCKFNWEFDMLRKLLKKKKIPTVLFSSKVSRKTALAHTRVKTFNENKHVRVFLGKVQLGVGINLQAANYAIFYSNDLSGTMRMQAINRNYRKGSEIHKSVVYYDVVSETGIDRDILSLVRKKNTATRVILKRLAKIIFNR